MMWLQVTSRLGQHLGRDVTLRRLRRLRRLGHAQDAARAAWQVTGSAISLAVTFTVQLGPILRLYVHLRRLAVERQDACQLVCGTAAGRRRILRVIARFYVAASAAGRT